MVMGGFSGWLAFYYLLYAAFIPAINLLLAPLLLVWLRSGRLALRSWNRYLIINAFISAFGFAVVPYSYVRSLLPYDHEKYFSFFGLLWTIIVIGFVLQEIFLVVWLTHFFRNKELANSFYKTWGWGFVLLNLIPNLLYFIWVISKL